MVPPKGTIEAHFQLVVLRKQFPKTWVQALRYLYWGSKVSKNRSVKESG
jgi:hypothetical protein